jgi:hypothetical protein
VLARRAFPARVVELERLWALWLAVSVLRWLAMAWKAFGSGEYFRAFPARKKAATPPPPPIAAG